MPQSPQEPMPQALGTGHLVAQVAGAQVLVLHGHRQGSVTKDLLQVVDPPRMVYQLAK